MPETLFVVVLSATCQELSSKPGAASGDSSACFQSVSAGRWTGAATGMVPVRLPVPVAWVSRALPFQVTRSAAVNTSMFLSSALSPVSATVRPPSRLVAVRSRWVPRTSTGPAAVSWRQKVSAVALSPTSSSIGRFPPPLTPMRIRPWCV